MQRVSAFLPSWDKRLSGASNGSSGTKPASGLFGWANRHSSAPRLPSRINVAAANGDRVQREAFWPATLDVECDKAARILRSFCTDGYLAPADADAPPPSSADGPPTPAKVPHKIPRRIIQNAAGIAVFTCMRSGLWMTGSGGSGILIARKSDGTWSPPSGILLHTPTLSFIIGVDIYDCVLVVNNLAALESMTRPRVTLGEDVGLTNGPSVPLDSGEAHINWRELGNTVLAYMKARGQHQAVNLNGCILTERSNENERFYEAAVSQMDILAGNVSRHVDETTPLFEVIKMAEGRSDFDAALVHQTAVHPAPGDAMIATPRMTSAPPRPCFGIPKADDPDPFGVLALEMAGLEIREAGTRLRPTSSQFDYSAVPLSPSLSSKLNRQSVETFVTRSNRASVTSSRTIRSQVTDVGAHTDTANTPETTPSPGQSEDGRARVSIDRIPEVKEDDESDYATVDLGPLRQRNQGHPVVAGERAADSAAPSSTDGDVEAPSRESSVYEEEDEEETNDADDEEDDLDEEEEEPVVYEVAAAQPARTQVIAPRVIHARGNVVTIAKRVAPPLPERSPARNSRSSGTIKDEAGGEVAGTSTPLRLALDDGGVKADDDEKSSATAETDADETTPRGRNADEAWADAAAASEPEADEPEGEQPGPEVAGGEDTGVEEAQADTTPTDMTPVEAPKAASRETRDEHGENPGSTGHKKHSSSIYTGATEDRWSCGGSSPTTPTSERRWSTAEDAAAGEGGRPPKLTEEAEEAEEREAHEGPKPTPPSAVAAA